MISGNDTSEIFSSPDRFRWFQHRKFDVSFHLLVIYPMAIPFTALDTTVANEIDIISPATIVVDSLSLSPVTMIAGAENIEARYYLRNSGQSAAQIRNITSRFWMPRTAMPAVSGVCKVKILQRWIRCWAAIPCSFADFPVVEQYSKRTISRQGGSSL